MRHVINNLKICFQVYVLGKYQYIRNRLYLQKNNKPLIYILVKPGRFLQIDTHNNTMLKSIKPIVQICRGWLVSFKVCVNAFCYIFFIRTLICLWNFWRSVRTGFNTCSFWCFGQVRSNTKSAMRLTTNCKCGPWGSRCLNVTEICRIRWCRTIFTVTCPMKYISSPIFCWLIRLLIGIFQIHYNFANKLHKYPKNGSRNFCEIFTFQLSI